MRRFAERGIYKTKEQYRYWDLIRGETQAYFRNWGPYVEIDTVGKSLSQVFEQFDGILSEFE